MVGAGFPFTLTGAGLLYREILSMSRLVRRTAGRCLRRISIVVHMYASVQLKVTGDSGWDRTARLGLWNFLGPLQVVSDLSEVNAFILSSIQSQSIQVRCYPLSTDLVVWSLILYNIVHSIVQFNSKNVANTAQLQHQKQTQHQRVSLGFRRYIRLQFREVTTVTIEIMISMYTARKDN